MTSRDAISIICIAGYTLVDDSIYYAVAMCMYMDNCTCSVCAGFGGGGRALYSPILVYAQCMMYVQVAKSFIPSIL